ncbi:YceD family protein [Rhizohabitans arisaemae]|uniref:YceD family protein n=1 Tax=Rhizohabitans arisaemae TaxID=2720610 RepID=UPI003D161CD3
MFSTHELGRRPGSMRRMTCTLPAPADLAVGMVGVPKDADVELELRFESVMEGVLVTGTAQAPLISECSRCLESSTSSIEVDFQELFFYPVESGLFQTGEEESVLSGDLLDLEPILRDAVVLALPLSPLCRDDCPGLCTECGIRLAEAGPDHRHEKLDARWADLGKLMEHNDNDQEG